MSDIDISNEGIPDGAVIEVLDDSTPDELYLIDDGEIILL